MNNPKPKFMSCSIHLIDVPWSIMKCDPVGLHHQYQAIEKMHRFCHEIYKVPITWLCSWPALHKYKDYLIDFIKNHGDEVAIMDGTIFSPELLNNEVQKYQSWVEECGLKRPGTEFQSKEAEVRRGSISLQDMTYAEQKTALTYLKKRYDEILGQNTRTLASPWNNGDTIKIMKEIGLDVSQGYCWNYFCEGINHKGSLFQSFYISDINHVVPDQSADKSKVLSVLWGPASPIIATSVEPHARMGGPAFCLNPLELANRSEGTDKFRFHEKIVGEWMEQAQWNGFAFLPLQQEAFWLDEAVMPPELYTQFPRFNPSNTEVFYTEIEAGLRVGAKPVTLSRFADWYKENIKDTVPQVYYSEDFLPEVKGKGKDQAYQPMVVYGDKKKQFFFMKSRGMNYIKRYLYDTPLPNKQIEEEYPFDNEPKVCLKAKSGLNIMAGIRLSQESACYEVGDFELSAYHDDPHYAAILWEINIPSYISDAEIKTGGMVTGFRTIREKNIAIVFAELKKGVNELVFRSDLPNKFIRIKSVEKVGRRYEIWIENDNEEVQLHSICAKLEPGLKIGGYWWDGFYSHSIFRYGWGAYDRETGAFEMRCFYPVTLKINRGLTRCSIELF